MKKRRRQQQQQPTKRQTSTKSKSTRSSRIVTKNFEVFVTDFLTDPCGLPVELKDYVLIDGSFAINENSDDCSLNNAQVLTNIFSNLLERDDKKLE